MMRAGFSVLQAIQNKDLSHILPARNPRQPAGVGIVERGQDPGRGPVGDSQQKYWQTGRRSQQTNRDNQHQGNSVDM